MAQAFTEVLNEQLNIPVAQVRHPAASVAHAMHASAPRASGAGMPRHTDADMHMLVRLRPPQQLKGVRILAELFRVRELRARISGTDWYDKLLTLVSQTSASDGVTASERYCLKLTLVRTTAVAVGCRVAAPGHPVGLSTAAHPVSCRERVCVCAGGAARRVAVRP